MTELRPPSARVSGESPPGPLDASPGRAQALVTKTTARSREPFIAEVLATPGDEKLAERVPADVGNAKLLERLTVGSHTITTDLRRPERPRETSPGWNPGSPARPSPYDTDDGHYEATRTLIKAEPGPLFLPVILLAEIDDLLNR